MRKLTHIEFVKRVEDQGINLEYLEQYNGRFKKIKARDESGIIHLVKPDKLFAGRKPSIYTAIDKTKVYVNKAIEIHKGKYNYSKAIYTGDLGKLKIKCSKHGYFLQGAGVHLMGCGCPKCGIEKMKLSRAKNGWTRTSWIEFCNASNSDPKLYIIHCYNDNEQFIKIGITKNKMKRRLSNYMMPYNYHAIKIISGTAGQIYDKERDLKKQFTNFKYNPSIDFHGKTECFSELIMEPILKLVA